MKLAATIVALFCSSSLIAQRSVRFEVRSGRDSTVIAAASVQAAGVATRAANDSGIINLGNLHSGQQLRFSAVGHQPVSYRITDSTAALVRILLPPSEDEEETVIISSLRTESRIENLPTRVEVLGSEEVDEESGVKPGNISSLLGDVAGIQSQQASAISGNVEMRVQGLEGKYTQLLRDGVPLFGAFAGNFSLLQLPPLDMKQVEIIKGASSTLYGGGAIAGMINIVTRRPVEGPLEKSVLINQTSLGETNINTYLSQRRGKNGFTFFAGANRQPAQDINGDGYSDLANAKSFFLHPVLYFYPGTRQTFSVGYNGHFEDRSGGDLQALSGKTDVQHVFFIRNRLARHTGDLQWDYRISANRRLTAKATGNWFDRRINTSTYSGTTLKARQLSWYSELSYLGKLQTHDLVAGINGTGQDFRSAQLPLPQESSGTLGLFVQDDWRVGPRWTIESGLRSDFNSRYGTFLLPRLSVLYRINTVWAARAGGGLGYRLPTVFESDVDERDYYSLRNYATKAERSAGANADINFHKRLGEVSVTVNQSVFITTVKNVAELQQQAGIAELVTMPGDQPIVTRGVETYVQLRADELDAYLGYTFTDALRRYEPSRPKQPLIARDKFAAVVSYEFSSRFRACIEASHIGPQYREDGSRTPSYSIAAFMVRYDWKALSFVLNCEDTFDYRQSKMESLVEGGSVQNPRFRELWAPIDGRVLNLSVRIKW